ncbi:ABC transporter substrate-binding protein [Macrococcoides caseolyticum subsp. hominis]|uniref:sugar ABC transporter substrate-binding protein n=1 Tax=Macrococcoides caseolyticum TaxID=69966 RepID=UPI000C145C82|nr:sugar ABC transporter substrate-binding protein [Macrococcus caseolyticus]RAI79217.1 ABC transporter substrate-binding protein [Macrococcus caseolyticus subsp. hominis]
MKKAVTILLASAVLLTGCGAEENKTSSNNGKKIAVIRNLGSDDHTKQFIEGAQAEGKKLGFKVDTFLSHGNDAKFKQLVNQAVLKKYDGVILSHGKEDYSYNLVKKVTDANIKVVTFDTKSDKDGKVLKNVVATSQDDHKLAELSLDALIKDKQKPVKVLKLWVGPGFLPLDKREEVYKKYVAAGKIKTVDTIGPTNFEDIQGDVKKKTEAVLAKHQSGDIDAVWGSWDEMTKGTYLALKEKQSKLPIYSIDISNQDLNYMKEKDSNWKTSASVNPKIIGQTDVRLLAKQLNSEKVEDTFLFKPVQINQSNLKVDTNMNNLAEVVPTFDDIEKISLNGK